MALSNQVAIPEGVEVSVSAVAVSAKGKLGTGEIAIHEKVKCENQEGYLVFSPKGKDKFAFIMTGTNRSLVSNLMTGVSEGFEKRLDLVGVGYRAQLKNKVLNLQLGFSHPINYAIPEGITIEVPSQTEVVVKGIDKQKVGQVAAEIRAYRPPEPYKGKGVKYSDEHILRKEAKKK